MNSLPLWGSSGKQLENRMNELWKSIAASIPAWITLLGLALIIAGAEKLGGVVLLVAFLLIF